MRGGSIHKESDKWYFTVSYYIIVIIRVNVCYNIKYHNYKLC